MKKNIGFSDPFKELRRPKIQRRETHGIQRRETHVPSTSPKIVDFSHLGAPDELRVDRYRDQQLATSSIDPSIARHPISNAQTSKTSELAFESRVSRYERTNCENQDPSHVRE